MTFNSLIPELSVTDLQKSLAFYTEILGFTIAYQRPEEGFAFLTIGETQIMLDEIGQGRTWKTGSLEFPLGRGINFQIEVKSIAPILERLKQNGLDLFMPVEEKWYRQDDQELGNKQFLVTDPDGYLLRFTEDLGVRSIN